MANDAQVPTNAAAQSRVPVDDITGDLSAHQAAMAWNRLKGRTAVPSRIESFQDARYGMSGRKSLTFRLHGVLENGGLLVAKKGDALPAAIERSVYEEIMPALGGNGLGYFGAFPSPADEMCWLFLEDAGEEGFSSAVPGHRAAAARWLATLHLRTAEWPTTVQLPDRDCSSYSRLAQELPELLRVSRDSVVLNARQRGVLDDLAPLLSTLVLDWCRIEEACSVLPTVIVHGDLIDKNMRMARDRGLGPEPTVLAFDWEMAGWGTPAVDLASARIGDDRESLVEYCAAVVGRWPHLTPDVLHAVARAGLVMRTTLALEWTLSSIGPKYLEKPFYELPYYIRVLRAFLQS